MIPLKVETATLVIYLFQDDDEAGCRWQTVGHYHIRRQESQTQSLVEQEHRAKQQTVQPGVTVRPRLGLWPQVELGVGNQQHRQEHADPRAHHQRELSKRIDQQVKVQHQSEAEEMKRWETWRILPSLKVIADRQDGDLSS